MNTGECDVCIGGYEGDAAEFYDSRVVKARKTHECYECKRLIAPGESYERVTGKWDDGIKTYRFCLICSEISIAFSCDGRAFGVMWEELEDFMFPTMTTGCLDKLKTPAAKQVLIDRWNKWKFK